ncbi:MAG: hypothetical protein CMO01_05080 [Thalassobius sp.]|nr:hypothetical protein [Thalassovita sp.]
MDKDQEFNDDQNWKEDILNSLEGMEKAKPSRNLLPDIERRINLSETKQVSFAPLNVAAAIAVILVVINVLVLSRFMLVGNNENVSSPESATQTFTLVNDFSIYE